MSSSTLSINPFRYVFKHLWEFRAMSMQSVFLVLMMALVNLPLPMMNMVVIDYVIPAGEFSSLLCIGLLAIFVRSAVSAFQIFQNFIIWQVMSGISHELRKKMLHSLLYGEYSVYGDGTMAAYIGRITSDVDSVETMIFDSFRFFIRPISMIFVFVIVMSFFSIPATLMILVFTPISMFLIRRMTASLNEIKRVLLEKREELHLSTSEVLENIRVIRCFNREGVYQNRIEKLIHTYSDMAIQYATKQHVMRSIIELIALIPWLALVFGGCYMIQTGELSVGEFMAFIAFEQLLRSPLGQLCFYLVNIKAEMVGPERVQELIDHPKEYERTDQSIDVNGDIVFADLAFAYPGGKQVLSAVNCEIKQGQRIAIVGSSGAGKSTIINLLMKFYSPSGGSILLNGIPIQDIPHGELRKHIGIVFQDNPMFDSSIRENLILNQQGLSEQQIWDALAQSDAKEFVESLPDKLDTIIGVKGLKLSGGQRQRLAIARVILKKPSLIILDEATSSLDSMSENQIQNALNTLLSSCTSITIAHRLSTVVASDSIIYLDEGIIQEQGTHAELIRKEKYYYNLFKVQTEGLLEKE